MIELITIATEAGYQMTKGYPVSEFLAIIKIGEQFVLTHRPTGGAVYSSNSPTMTLYFALAVEDFDWDWSDPDVKSEQCKAQMAALAAIVNNLKEAEL